MKINKAKLLVGTLAVAAVAATVGSISGTVAWFQYSTRVTAAYSGAAAHVSENLQIRLFRANTAEEGQSSNGYDSGWLADLSRAEINKYITNVRGENVDHDLRPVTSGGALAQGGVATSFYKSPIYQYSSTYDKWGAASATLDYIELPIELRVLDRNGAGENDEFLAKKVYLTDLTVKDGNASTDAQHKDISDALRVSFDLGAAEGATKVTFSNKGGVVNTSGYLDLNADDEIDLEEGYEWDERDPFLYGGTAVENDDPAATTETTTKIRDAQTAATTNDYLADDSNPESIVGKELGTTTDDGEGLQIKVRIYLEGWQKLDCPVTGVTTTYADKDALLAAHSSTEVQFTAEAGVNYKTTDGKFWTLNENEDDFEEVTKAESAIWDDDAYVSAAFNVGMRFSVEAHKDSDHA